MTIPISSFSNPTTVPVPVPNSVTVSVFDPTTVHEKINYSESSTKAEAETITKSTINKYDSNVFFASSSRTITEQCTFPK